MSLRSTSARALATAGVLVTMTVTGPADVAGAAVPAVHPTDGVELILPVTPTQDSTRSASVDPAAVLAGLGALWVAGLFTTRSRRVEAGRSRPRRLV